MTQNKYDDPAFFEKYSQMSRSKNGLEGAGEWHVLQRVLPDFTNKTVLDLGCGYGWHSIYAIEHGAKKVIASDISSKMIATARIKNNDPRIKYECIPFEESNFGEAVFDIVICSLMIHYLPSYQDFVKKVNKWLKTGGYLVFNVEHPVFTAKGDQDWYYNEAGEIEHFPVDNYYLEGKREAVFLGEKVIKYHRTLTTYLNELLNGGFEIIQVKEPTVSSNALIAHPEFKDELRRPMMLIVSARKK